MASPQYTRVPSHDSTNSKDLPALSTALADGRYDEVLSDHSVIEGASVLTRHSSAGALSRSSMDSTDLSDAESMQLFSSSLDVPATTPAEIDGQALMSGALPLNASLTNAQVHSGSPPSTLLLQPQRNSLRLGLQPRKLSSEERLRYVVSPQTHSSTEQLCYFPEKHYDGDLDKTARFYGSWQQSKRLWRLAAIEWLVTASLCAMFAGVLASYSKRHTLRTSKVLQINTILTGITFLLGVNLASSMRSYAKLLRWRLLARDYQPLEIFDLILRCESLLNVCKLIWRVKIHKKRSFRWKTRAFCIGWLLANVALTLFVGMIGLTYSIDPQGDWYVTDTGIIEITDFSALKDENINRGLRNVQNWGSRGFLMHCPDMTYHQDKVYACRSRRDGVAYYNLRSWNPEDPATDGLTKSRVVSKTTCESANVTRGGSGNSKTITYTMDNIEQDYHIVDEEDELPGPNGLLVASRRCDDCTNRSTELRVFAPGGSDNAVGQLFFCQNHVEEVKQKIKLPNGSGRYERAPEEYQFTDFVARMLAGAAGWSGTDLDNYAGTKSRWSSMTYQSITEIGEAWRDTYGPNPSTANISDFISTFTLKAMYAIELAPKSVHVTKQAQGQIPKHPQVLNVKWIWAGLLLGGIPALQLVACMTVFFIANRAIIKDDSPLAMAKLYWSLLDKYGFGEKGCILRGDEIIEYIGHQTDRRPGGPSVIYGWKYMGQTDFHGSRIGHVDVFENESDDVRPTTPSMKSPQRSPLMGSFKDGIRYNGIPTGSDSGVDRSTQEVKKRIRRLSF